MVALNRESTSAFLFSNAAIFRFSSACFALYFSRAVIPHARDGESDGQMKRHVGLYAYRVAALRRLADAGVCELESIEMLEQLRCLWHGMRIIVADACAPPPRGVDTAEDLAYVRAQVR